MNGSRRFQRRAVLPLLVGVVAFCAGAWQSAVFGLPVPAVHDEFSYLLAADTFLHGRCANPPHPLWQHFETMHVLQQPTYASKYPPGQGLFLAAGRLAGGHAALGVWAGMGLACAAITWMLQGFVPRGWALVGGTLVAFQLGFGEWGDSYWGGGVAAAGGALFVGGWVRNRRRPRLMPSLFMATGLVLLAVTRPFEGLLLCLPVALATAFGLARRRPPAGDFCRRCLLSSACLIVPAAFGLGFYNNAVTGSAFRLPYFVHAEQYAVAPVLVIQSPRPEPEYRHPALREFYVGSEYENTHRLEQTREGWSLRVKAKLQIWWETYLGYGLTPALLVLPFVLLASRRTQFALGTCVFLLGFVATLETWGFSHYVAPVAGLIYLVVVQCFRYISLWQVAGHAIGRAMAALWIAACLVLPVCSLLPEWHKPRRAWASARADAVRRFRTDGGRHLVIVRYGEDHSVHEEWVYNDADIDAAPVVWAREMGPEGRSRLLDYFKDRTVWLLEEDGSGPHWQRLRGPLVGGRESFSTR
jgi:hypothetical protein